LRRLKRFDADERFVDLLVRPDPLRGVVPPHLRLVAERDILDVDEDF
jgi:hypothetical protein